MPFGNWFKHKPKIGGQIGYFGLTDWWLSTFTEAERKYIESVYKPMGYHPNAKPLTEGTIHSTTQTATGLLGGLGGWFKKTEDRSIAKRILAKAESIGRHGSDVLDLHFVYQTMIQSAYRARDVEPGAIEEAITACEKQIALAPKAARAFKKEFPSSPLPAHVGYTQLAIIRENQKNYAEAIRLAKQADRQGWNGDWDKRIARCERKLAKESGT